MKRAICLVCVLAFAMPAIATVDLQVGDQIRFFDREGDGRGGEFGVAKTSAVNTELFRTFCIEVGEFLDFNAAGFKVVGITDRAILGGEASGFDIISDQTAYLYSKFRSQSLLTSYDYTPGTQAHIDDADALQQAFWHLENEAGWTNYGGLSAKAKAFVDEANNAVTTNAWVGLGNVRVANLVWATTRGNYTEGQRAQDVLVLVPAPGAAVLAFLGLGIVGWVKRRMA